MDQVIKDSTKQNSGQTKIEMQARSDSSPAADTVVDKATSSSSSLPSKENTASELPGVAGLESLIRGSDMSFVNKSTTGAAALMQHDQALTDAISLEDGSIDSAQQDSKALSLTSPSLHVTIEIKDTDLDGRT
jgi:hypothetical protein